MWDGADKAVGRGKFINLNTCVRKEDFNSKTSTFTLRNQIRNNKINPK